ncbi:MAG: class I SAM-dependent methyltransferase [Bacillota bacterium]|nr:class I SAM-dependent methyltransferase [Bacillota bacterium]
MYTNLAGYFEAIFPVGETQLGLIREVLQLVNGRRVLDAACGSGGYSFALTREGCAVTGIDLDPGMIAYAKEQAYRRGLSATFRAEDMRCINERDGEFSLVLCMGNSLPHLLHDEDLKKALCEMQRVLSDEGVLLLQNINYDWVLKSRPSQLPVIEHPERGIAFSRSYDYRDDGLVDFTTCLTISDGEGQKEYGGKVPLRPITREELTATLADCGFKSVDVYGGFDKRPFSDDTFHIVVLAKKG